mmetsp:Transcript_30221/g.73500  ORF Transcript_30221/g.73500 Transcript_30221/m.73500 type:complete len:335 (-) Transcript_30221:237-1241(-)
MLTTLNQSRNQLMRVVPRVTAAVPKTVLGAAISTKTQETIEELIENNWHDVADEVNATAHILDECKTNHAIPSPSPDLERHVDQKMHDVQHLMRDHHHSSLLHNQAFAKVHVLKDEVRHELYNFDRPSARYFSTDTAARRMMSTALSAEHQVDEFESAAHELHWKDVEDEAELIRSLLHESKTNHAVQKPDAALIDMVETTLADLQKSIALNPTKHGKIFARLHALKGLVKAKIYADVTPLDDHVAQFESVMHALKWDDVEDLTVEIDHLMHEGHTNHAIPLPNAKLQKLVDETLDEVQRLLVVKESPSLKNHDIAFARLQDLKRIVKSHLYGV